MAPVYTVTVSGDQLRLIRRAVVNYPLRDFSQRLTAEAALNAIERAAVIDQQPEGNPEPTIHI